MVATRRPEEGRSAGRGSRARGRDRARRIAYPRDLDGWLDDRPNDAARAQSDLWNGPACNGHPRPDGTHGKRSHRPGESSTLEGLWAGKPQLLEKAA